VVITADTLLSVLSNTQRLHSIRKYTLSGTVDTDGEGFYKTFGWRSIQSSLVS